LLADNFPKSDLVNADDLVVMDSYLFSVLKFDHVFFPKKLELIVPVWYFPDGLQRPSESVSISSLRHDVDCVARNQLGLL